MTVSGTRGTSSLSPFTEQYGEITRARGSLDLLRSAGVVGIALIVERWYDGSTFGNGESVIGFGGRMISGGS